MKNWPADKVERRKVSALLPYARNARTHSPEQVAQIARSITEFGFTNPVLVDETGTIIAGHGRVLAAKKLALADVPVIVAEGWTEAQKRAYVIADNKLAENAGWDISLLRMEIGELKAMDFDLSLTGFDPSGITSLLNTTGGETDPDDVPAESTGPATARRGDVWTLGRHRLMCGDSTSAEDVVALLDGRKPHLMVTDPPYGVEYDADWRNKALRADDTPSDGRAVGKVANDDRADWREAWALFPGDVAYVWHGALHSSVVQESLIATGFVLRTQIVWSKQHFVISRGDYHYRHEPCWYAVRKGGKSHWGGKRDQQTVWEVAHRRSETGHSTQKPVECMKRPIENNSVAGDAVYEPFSGSGTTIIAAEMTGRDALAMEISPAYVDVAIKRWQAFAGKEATLDGTTFAAVAAQRAEAAV